MLDMGKKFKFFEQYEIARALPRFAVPMDGIDPRVQSALGLDDVAEDITCESAPVVTLAKRPAVGKKAAKKAKFSHISTDAELETPQRIAVASEAKNRLMEEQLAVDKVNSRITFFNMNPESEASKLFFAL
ncbi:hypothetical protein PR001_g18754 [Phytophthora rubi]|uniref:Uncharacterized protein n=1 Tax=Phytophthora rubi TaxID=129364 RepID=A0A6A3K0B9_9STRA|nr:hypothetical protein PR001_g18754 [Phytophthora rubi]